MAQQQSDNFMEEFVSVAFSPPALVALLVLMALTAGPAVLVTARLAELASSVGMAMVGLITTAISVLQGLAAITVLYVLSRMLGSANGAAGRPNFGAWLGFGLLYFFIVWLANTIIVFIASAVMGLSYWLVPIVTGLFGVAVRLMLFPLLVRLVSLAHNREGPSFAAIWAFLTSERPGIYGGYAGLAAMAGLLPLIGMAVRSMSQGGASGSGVYLILGLAFALGQLLLFAYAIATYRCIRGNGGTGSVFS